MKKGFIYGIIGLVVATGFAFQAGEIEDLCKSKEAMQKSKNALKPFNYDLSEVTEITFGQQPQVKEVEVPLFFGEKYRFIFNLEGLAQRVDIEIYNKKEGAKNRELLFTSKDKQDINLVVFEPKKSKKMYVNYLIPSASGKSTKGCSVMVVGYEFK
ncbi:MAG: hypothetical protein KKA07_00495 [Bacteroidetes bacterium]|nr:hypothetical protein [Bacteroidota bacterium]MBU1717530.1 hypothetical protein [Bacteroidota bacterium]